MCKLFVFFIAASRDNVVMALPAHGGHLGFFEGFSFFPNTMTWLDRLVIQYADAVVQILQKDVSDGKEAQKYEIGKLTTNFISSNY